MKKLTSALLVSASFTTAAFAGAPAASNATGFYVGGNLGLANTQSKYNFTNSNKFATKAPNSSVNPKGVVTAGAALTPGNSQNSNYEGGKFNPQFGLFLGYGAQFGQAYVGAEIFGGLDTAKVTPYDDTGTDPGVVTGGTVAPAGKKLPDDAATSYGLAYWKTTVKRTAFYGLAFRGGFFISPSSLLFAKIGIEGGQWKVTADASNMVISYGLDANAAYAADVAATERVKTQTKNSINFLAGLGMEIYVTKNLFVRGEWSYLFGPSVQFDQNVTVLNAVKGTALTHTNKITQNRFSIGVGFKF